MFVVCVFAHVDYADYDVCWCRLLSQLADVNIQPTVGMFAFYDVTFTFTFFFVQNYFCYCYFSVLLYVHFGLYG